MVSVLLLVVANRNPLAVVATSGLSVVVAILDPWEMGAILCPVAAAVPCARIAPVVELV